MSRRRSGPDDLLVYLLVFREDGAWLDIRSEEVNAYLQEKAGEEFSRSMPSASTSTASHRLSNRDRDRTRAVSLSTRRCSC
jgi:hypothetical protein